MGEIQDINYCAKIDSKQERNLVELRCSWIVAKISTWFLLNKQISIFHRYFSLIYFWHTHHMQKREWTNRHKNRRPAVLSIAPLQPISRSDAFFHRTQFRKCCLYVCRRLWVIALFLLQFSSCGRRSARYSWLHRLNFQCVGKQFARRKLNNSRCARYVRGNSVLYILHCFTRDREHIRLRTRWRKNMTNRKRHTWQLWNAIGYGYWYLRVLWNKTSTRFHLIWFAWLHRLCWSAFAMLSSHRIISLLCTYVCWIKSASLHSIFDLRLFPYRFRRSTDSTELWFIVSIFFTTRRTFFDDKNFLFNAS